MYIVPCDTDCCDPDQFDCTQVMEQNNATEWEYLKVRYVMSNVNTRVKFYDCVDVLEIASSASKVC